MAAATITLNLDPALLTRLQALAEERGADPNHYAVALLSEAVAREEGEEDTELTPADIEAMRAGIQRGLDDFAAGRFRSLEEVQAEHEAARRQRGTLP